MAVRPPPFPPIVSVRTLGRVSCVCLLALPLCLPVSCQSLRSGMSLREGVGTLDPYREEDGLRTERKV